eukprot:g28799.t1
MNYERKLVEDISNDTKRFYKYIKRKRVVKVNVGSLQDENGIGETTPLYCVQFWSPYLRKDVVALKAVCRRFTRLIPGMKGLSCEEQLNNLDLYSLEFRRMRDDLIE